MRNLFIVSSLLLLAACGKVESPTEFFDLTGKDGSSGKNATSCFSEKVDGGVNVVCGDTSQYLPDGNNGLDGQDGSNGQDGDFTGILEYVEVCRGSSTASYIETLVHLDGKYLAFLSDKNYKKQRLVLLLEGINYRTTDGRDRLFSIENGVINCK